MAQDNKYHFFQALTIFVLLGSIVLMVWAGRDLYLKGVTVPKEKKLEFIKALQDTSSVQVTNLLLEYVSMSEEIGDTSKFNADTLFHEKNFRGVINKMSNGRIASDLARLLSSFTAGLFVLLWFFLYRENKSKAITEKQRIVTDYTLLFFALAMLVWGLPTHEVFPEDKKIYEDTIAVLNTLFFLCAYWDIENKFPRIIEIQMKKWRQEVFTIKRSTYYVIVFVLGIVAWIKYELLFSKFDIAIMSLLALGFFISIFRRFGNYTNHRPFTWDKDTAIGIGLGVYSIFGFSVVAFSYLNDDPDSDFFLIILYQFLLIITTSILAFSWVYEKMIKDAIDREGKLKEERKKLEEKNLKLKEKENDLRKANDDLRKAKDVLDRHLALLKSQKTELEETNFKLTEAKEEVENSRVDALHSMGNSLRRIRSDFEERSKSETNNPVKADVYKYAALNLDILLGLFENRKNYGKEYVNFCDYINFFLEEINKLFAFDKFDYVGRVNVNDSIECNSLLVQKVAKILYELSLNALDHGNKWAEIDIWLNDDSVMTIKVKDKGGFFDINKESSRQGLKIIREYIRELDSNPTPLVRDNSTTILLFNFSKLLRK